VRHERCAAVPDAFRRQKRQFRPAGLLSHYCPKSSGVFGTMAGGPSSCFNAIAFQEASPEKAGVGGSIPSLATILTPV